MSSVFQIHRRHFIIGLGSAGLAATTRRPTLAASPIYRDLTRQPGSIRAWPNVPLRTDTNFVTDGGRATVHSSSNWQTRLAGGPRFQHVLRGVMSCDLARCVGPTINVGQLPFCYQTDFYALTPGSPQYYTGQIPFRDAAGDPEPEDI